MDFQSTSSSSSAAAAADPFANWGFMEALENNNESRPLAKTMPAHLVAAQQQYRNAKTKQEKEAARKKLAKIKALIAKQRANLAATIKRRNTKIAAARKSAAAASAKKQKQLANLFGRSARASNRSSRAAQARMAASSAMNNTEAAPIGDPSLAFTHPERGSIHSPVRNLYSRPYTKTLTRGGPYRNYMAEPMGTRGKQYATYTNMYPPAPAAPAAAAPAAAAAAVNAMQGGRRRRTRRSRRHH